MDGKDWKVTISIDGMEKPDLLQLIDLKTILGSYLQLKAEFFKNLINKIKETKYGIGKGIEEVFDPKGDVWTENPWLLLLVKDKEQSIPFWFLLKRERNLSGFIVAIGPNGFIDYLNDKLIEEEEEIKKLIDYVMSYPEKFELMLLIPNFIA